jgi:hypothetical protein
MPRYRKRVDENLREIVEALRLFGASVLISNAEIDLIVGHRGVNYLLEVKSAKRRSRLQAVQLKMVTEWKGQYAVVTSAKEALAVIGAE